MQILLHLCCGPCALMPIQALRNQGYEVIGYFANPNIHPSQEYLRRRAAMQEVAEQLNLSMLWQDDAYNLPAWLAYLHEHNLTQKPQRCAYCYQSRLVLTQAAAIAHGINNFSTSLLYSRYQDHEQIKNIGQELPGFYYQDFRQLWQSGQDLAKTMNIYRQNYCACIFSEAERFAGKFSKLIAAKQ